MYLLNLYSFARSLLCHSVPQGLQASTLGICYFFTLTHFDAWTFCTQKCLNSRLPRDKTATFYVCITQGANFSGSVHILPNPIWGSRHNTRTHARASCNIVIGKQFLAHNGVKSSWRSTEVLVIQKPSFLPFLQLFCHLRLKSRREL